MIFFLMAAAAQAPAAPANPATITIAVERLRNTRGTVRVCMTRDRAHFPDCRGDPAALVHSAPAAAPSIAFGRVPPGSYAIAIFHDENDNRKLDTWLGMPREGFGFSRNPAIGFGAPKFDDVKMRTGTGSSRITIRMHYLL